MLICQKKSLLVSCSIFNALSRGAIRISIREIFASGERVKVKRFDQNKWFGRWAPFIVRGRKYSRNMTFKSWNISITWRKCFKNVTFKPWQVSKTWRSNHEIFQKRDVQNMKCFYKTWRSNHEECFSNWDIHNGMKCFSNVTFKIWNIFKMWRWKHKIVQKSHVSETLFGHLTPFCCGGSRMYRHVQLCNV